MSEFVYITDDTYTKRQVLRMEHLVLKVNDTKSWYVYERKQTKTKNFKFYPPHSRCESDDMSDINSVKILGVGVRVGIADDAPVCLQDERHGGKLREDHQLGNV